MSTKKVQEKKGLKTQPTVLKPDRAKVSTSESSSSSASEDSDQEEVVVKALVSQKVATDCGEKKKKKASKKEVEEGPESEGGISTCISGKDRHFSFWQVRELQHKRCPNQALHLRFLQLIAQQRY